MTTHFNACAWAYLDQCWVFFVCLVSVTHVTIHDEVGEGEVEHNVSIVAARAIARARNAGDDSM